MLHHCIIIDDQQHAINALAQYIDKLPQLILIATYTDPFEALLKIDGSQQVDIIFMDIDMPGINGIELASQLRPFTRFLIFNTAHARYALDAFGVNANNYLLKPYPFSKFALTIGSLITPRLPDYHQRQDANLSRFRFIKGEGKADFLSVNLDQVVHVQADRNYVEIHTLKPSKPHLIRIGINRAEKLLQDSGFIRISKSVIVSKAYIKQVKGNTIILDTEKVFPISPIYRAGFLVFMDQNLLR
ncbi:LytTR family DNA-binding domain-containing protein [Pedobacter sp. Hv1]|uniref:LytR/AlgR family response regulator transcription factor n=1 Tax=Pedobacter sp. Hv1 TaxID=1740090 RepID=UPI0006D8BA11|nr:LytTR family DNA-binding domain-containing protein [Pedobacter sp. Hv1]KQC02760.1 hypothetical protein AQF98_04075 [Pedobacter sp. Hv1]